MVVAKMETAADMVRTPFDGLVPNHDRDRDDRVRVLEWEKEHKPEGNTSDIVVGESTVEEKAAEAEPSAFVGFEGLTVVSEVCPSISAGIGKMCSLTGALGIILRWRT